ncbi:hypothetical protein WDW89_02875 [Deltaproteobacteria bacterium TL4]
MNNGLRWLKYATICLGLFLIVGCSEELVKSSKGDPTPKVTANEEKQVASADNQKALECEGCTVAEFNSTTGRIPTPNDLSLSTINSAFGIAYDPANPTEENILGMNAGATIAIPFNGAIQTPFDGNALTDEELAAWKQGIVIFPADDPSSIFYALPAEYPRGTTIEGGKFAKVSFNTTTNSLMLTPLLGTFEHGKKYVVVVTKSLKNSAGVGIGEELVFGLTKNKTSLIKNGQPHALLIDADKAKPGTAKTLEAIRQSYAPLYEGLEAAGIPRKSVAVLTTFTPNADVVAQLDSDSGRLVSPNVATIPTILASFGGSVASMAGTGLATTPVGVGHMTAISIPFDGPIVTPFDGNAPTTEELTAWNQSIWLMDLVNAKSIPALPCQYPHETVLNPLTNCFKKISFSSITNELILVPTETTFAPGGQYAVIVTSSMKSTSGKSIRSNLVFRMLKQKETLSKAFPLLASKDDATVASLVALQAGIAPVLTALETSNVDRANVHMVAIFATRTGVVAQFDSGSSRVPNPSNAVLGVIAQTLGKNSVPVSRAAAIKMPFDGAITLPSDVTTAIKIVAQNSTDGTWVDSGIAATKFSISQNSATKELIMVPSLDALAAGTRYAVIVTNSIMDTQATPVAAGEDLVFSMLKRSEALTNFPLLASKDTATVNLLEGMRQEYVAAIAASGVAAANVVMATTFTTSASPIALYDSDTSILPSPNDLVTSKINGAFGYTAAQSIIGLHRNTAIKIPFDGAVATDATNLAANVFVLDVTAGGVLVSLSGNFIVTQDSSHNLTLKPNTNALKRGNKYAVIVKKTLPDATGTLTVEEQTLTSILKSPKALIDSNGFVQLSLVETSDKATILGLEALRGGYNTLMTALISAGTLTSSNDVASMVTFTTQANVEPQLDSATGRVATPNVAALPTILGAFGGSVASVASTGLPTAGLTLGMSRMTTLSIPFDGAISTPFNGDALTSTEVTTWKQSIWLINLANNSVIDALPCEYPHGTTYTDASGKTCAEGGKLFQSISFDSTTNDLILVPGTNTLAAGMPYAVVVTNNMKDSNGKAIGSSIVFRMVKHTGTLSSNFLLLKSESASTIASLAALQGGASSILTALAAGGVSRDNVAMLFTFATRSGVVAQFESTSARVPVPNTASLSSITQKLGKISLLANGQVIPWSRSGAIKIPFDGDITVPAFTSQTNIDEWKAAVKILILQGSAYVDSGILPLPEYVGTSLLSAQSGVTDSGTFKGVYQDSATKNLVLIPKKDTFAAGARYAILITNSLKDAQATPVATGEDLVFSMLKRTSAITKFPLLAGKDAATVGMLESMRAEVNAVITGAGSGVSPADVVMVTTFSTSSKVMALYDPSDTGELPMPNDLILGKVNPSLVAAGKDSLTGIDPKYNIRIPFDGPITTDATVIATNVLLLDITDAAIGVVTPTTVTTAGGVFKAIYQDANYDLVLVPGASTLTYAKKYAILVKKALNDNTGTGSTVEEQTLLSILKLSSALIDSHGDVKLSLVASSDKATVDGLEALRSGYNSLLSALVASSLLTSADDIASMMTFTTETIDSNVAAATVTAVNAMKAKAGNAVDAATADIGWFTASAIDTSSVNAANFKSPISETGAPVTAINKILKGYYPSNNFLANTGTAWELDLANRAATPETDSPHLTTEFAGNISFWAIVPTAAVTGVVIYQHGITRNKNDVFAVANTLASQGFITLAIDAWGHGERVYEDADGDGTVEDEAASDAGDSGRAFIRPDNPSLTTGYMIQSLMDITKLIVMSKANAELLGAVGGSGAIPTHYVGHSLGAIFGGILGSSGASGANTLPVTRYVLNVPGGDLADILLSGNFGPSILSGIAASLSLTPNSSTLFATVLGIDLLTTHALAKGNADVLAVTNTTSPTGVLLQQITGDATIPNANTELVAQSMGLTDHTDGDGTQADSRVRWIVKTDYSATTSGASDVPGHGSLIDSKTTATCRLQSQMLTYLVNGGIIDPSSRALDGTCGAQNSFSH